MIEERVGWAARAAALSVFVFVGCAARRPLREAPPPNAVRPAPNAWRCTELEPLLAPLLSGHWVRGASVALLDARHTETCGFGAAREAPTAPDADTLYEVGSITKVFTGVLLAQAALRGEVTLEQPLSALLEPELRLAENGRPITLLDLATHRSGLPRVPDDMPAQDPENPYANYDLTHLFASLSRVKPERAGERSLYSNFGAGVLGQALAKSAHTPYPELLRARILEPLGMADSFLTVPSARDARRAQGHDGDDTPKAAWDLNAMAPAGGLHTSARDLARFARAALFTNTTSLGPAFQLAEQARAESNEGGRIGLFFQIQPDGIIWHNGETGGFSSYFALDPRRQVAVVVLLSTAFARQEELGARVLAYAQGQPVLPLDVPGLYTPPVGTLGEYAGDYALDKDFVIHVWLNENRLYARAPGQSPLVLWPSAADRFYLRVVDARIEFERDATHTVSALILDQDGKRRRAPRSALSQRSTTE